VVMSSHVLEDVARTCDSVVVLREGRVVATRTLQAPDRDGHGDVEVQIIGDAEAFGEAVRRLGLAIRPSGERLLVSGGDSAAVLRGVRDAACAAGVGVHELRPAGPTLEESLIGAIG
jgi:ABC-type multidrug transport system ATPase subunit